MGKIDSGDTAWLLVSTALVMLMTPGLALFYGGMVQSKNVLATFMHSFLCLGLVTLQWVICGYSLAFAPSHGGVIGGLDFALLQNVAGQTHGTVPHLLFVAYQGMFAAITPALISGAFAERMRFAPFCVFTLLWSVLVYDPVAHWVWGPNGWLANLGALDFAGGTVVHLSSGFSALVFALVLGPRTGYPRVRHHPHNLTMTITGAGLLWFGWFGFNAGSSFAADGVAALALINSHIAAAAGAVTWAAIEARVFGKATILGVASGLVAGLVGITPAAGFVGPAAAAAIGVLTAGVCYLGVGMKLRLGYDDALDAFGVHGIGGAFGALLTGVFAAKAFNAAGADGLVAGGGVSLVGKQALSVVVAVVYSMAVTCVLLKILDKTMGLRVTPDQEREGLDRALHGETGYVF